VDNSASTMMGLYDETFIDSLPAFLSSGPNSGVTALCGRDVPEFIVLRLSVERWFAELDNESQARLCPKLRSMQNDVFTPTLFEVALGAFFAHRGFTVDYEPVIAGLTPDFRVQVNGMTFICEVATLFDSRDVQEKLARVKELEAWLNERLVCEYGIGMGYDEWPGEVDKEQVLAELEQRISSVSGDLTQFDINCGGLTANVILEKAHSGKRNGRIGSRIYPMMSGSPTSRLRESLVKKAKKYKKLNLPVVLAICSPGNFQDFDNIDIAEATYGTEHWRVDSDTLDTRLLRQRNGLFSELRNEGTPRRRHVNGVLVVQRKLEPGGFRFPMRYYANPFANADIPDAVFEGIPRRRSEKCGDGMFRLVGQDEDAPPPPLW